MISSKMISGKELCLILMLYFIVNYLECRIKQNLGKESKANRVRMKESKVFRARMMISPYSKVTLNS